MARRSAKRMNKSLGVLALYWTHSSVVERTAHNRLVVGSIPTVSTLGTGCRP